MEGFSLFLDKVLKRYRKVLYRRRYRKESAHSNGTTEARVNPNGSLFFHSDDKDKLTALYRRYFLERVNKAIKAADDICEHKFNIFGCQVDHGPKIQWALDPVSGNLWEDRFSFDIVYKGERRLGDIRFVWELNKHQYFFTLGKAYWITGDEKYAEEIVGQIGSWMNENPFCRGINWISALEIGARVISWIMAYPFVKEKMGDDFAKKFTRSIYAQLEFIEENLSFARFPNTHLIGEAAALFIGGLFLESPRSEKWIYMGLKILAKQLDEQVHKDGAHKEQSLNYHRFFLDYYYLMLILLKKNRIAYPAKIEACIEKMTEFVLYTLRPDGTAPSFGDADDARGIFVYQDCVKDYLGLLALGATIYQRGDFKYVAKGIAEEVFWLLGEEGVNRFLDIEAKKPAASSMALEDAGYYAMRDGWNPDSSYLIFDCGPLGFGQGGHGHADALSFQLSYKGFNFIIDPGTYSYNLDYEWRDYFRSTLAHNTIVIDSLNQSEMMDRMSWISKAQAKCNLWLSMEQFDFVDGEHDGYARLRDPVLHRRMIFFGKPHYWLITDVLSCSRSHTVCRNFHFHPDVLVNFGLGPNVLEAINSGEKRIKIVLLGEESKKTPMIVFKGDQEKKIGWYSEKYGTKSANPTLKITDYIEGGKIYTTFISSVDMNYKVERKLSNGEGIYVLVIDPLSKNNDHIFFSVKRQAQVIADFFSFQGRFLFIRRGEKGISFVYAMDFTRLEIEKELSYSSPNKTKEIKYSAIGYEVSGRVEDFKGSVHRSGIRIVTKEKN